MYEKIWGVALLGDLGPDRAVRADELDLLELLPELLRAERGFGIGPRAWSRSGRVALGSQLFLTNV